MRYMVICSDPPSQLNFQPLQRAALQEKVLKAINVLVNHVVPGSFGVACSDGGAGLLLRNPRCRDPSEMCFSRRVVAGKVKAFPRILF